MVVVEGQQPSPRVSLPFACRPIQIGAYLQHRLIMGAYLHDINSMTPTTSATFQDVVARDYTIHMHKRVHCRSFKKRAPWVIESIVDFTTKAMGTTDVRIDPKLNQAVWAQGIKSVPHRLRVRLESAYTIYFSKAGFL